MAGQEILYPLEIFIAQTPKSLGASSGSRTRWKDTVAEIARHRISETDELGFLDVRPVSVIIFYFLSEPMEGDIDNIVKPILDALIGKAYLDDNQVERVLAQKFEPGFNPAFIAPSAKLAEALSIEPPVVYIRVDDDLSWRRLA